MLFCESYDIICKSVKCLSLQMKINNKIHTRKKRIGAANAVLHLTFFRGGKNQKENTKCQ